MFAMKLKSFEKDKVILDTDQPIESLYIINEGILEVSTSFEQNEFVIDKLGRGSILNHRTFFKKDAQNVTIRAAKDCRVFELELDSFKEIIWKYMEKRNKCMKAVDRYQNKIVKQPIKYPLDYICVNSDEKKVEQSQIARSTKLKNTIMNVVIKNREIKNRPKLSDFMKVYRE